jgi:tetratricopeptide (TPR) repeat protein
VASGPEAVFAAGAAALEAGDFQAAERLFQQIVDRYPRAHMAWNALSVVALRAGFPDVAAEHAKRALELDRRNPVYLNTLGVVHGELGSFTEAEQAFRRALKARPAYAEGHFNLGKALHKLGRLDEALRALERAYAIDAEFPGVRASLCQMYRKHGRAERAMAALREMPGGLERDDEFTPLVAETLDELEGAQNAVAWLRQVIERHADWYAARYTLGKLLLALGEWRGGWREYLWRPHLLPERSERAPAPLLPRLSGVRVLVRGEQGLGDALFFLRFAGELRRRGAEVGLAVPRKLTALLGDAGGCEVLAEEDAPAARFERVIWGGDLPALLESDAAPGAFPLVRDAAAAARWRRRLAELGPAPYLALTWRAGTDVLTAQEFGRERGLQSKEAPPAALGEALRGWRGTLLSVQRQPRAGETAALAAAARAQVHDLSALNDELPEILAALSVVEEYVCVSNTNVHLLAGIGRAARVLVPYPAEWRWMREGASPWFPGFSVYREPQARGWEKPLLDLRKDLSL